MEEKKEAIITEIKKFATHDGPGIRTTIFLKGCPLRCKWCSNPETQKISPQLYYIEKKCKDCGDCVEICPENAISTGKSKDKIDRNKCNRCMKCVEKCLYGSLRKVGKKYSLREIVEEVKKDKPFYGSRGGLTISGGEPFYQAEFTISLLKNIKELGLTTVLDTSGYTEPEIVKEAVKYTDMVLLDIKHMDSRKHKEGTGVKNDIILKNAEIFADKLNLRISLPLIPDYNISDNNIKETAKFANSLRVKWIDVNPIHFLGADKYHYLGMSSPFTTYSKLEKNKIMHIKEILNSYKLNVSIGRMM